MILGSQLLLSVVVGLSVLTLFYGIRTLITSGGESSDRLQQFLDGSHGVAPTLRQIEMQGSFYRRIVYPLINSFLKLAGRFAPKQNLELLQKKLETAGFPANLSVADFLGLKILAGATIGILITLLVYIIRPDISLLIVVAVGFLFGFVGFLLPNLWLARRITRRKREVIRQLPDALDLLTICVGAGLGLSGAMQRVATAWDNVISEEFNRLIAEVKLGLTRIEALENMATRTDVDEVKSFVMALALADKLGVSISQVLRVQAEQMRVTRRQKAEEAAREASIKMLFPLVFLIFPAMFAVILGPAIPQLLEVLGSL